MPSVQIIGAQKAGTSALADWLFDGGYRRPRVLNNEPWYYSKEVHFFECDWRYNKGLEFYAKRFESKQSDFMDCTMTIDATPETLQFPERVRSTYEAAGGHQANHLKILVILREPVSRELSLYNHLVFDILNLDVSERNEWNNQVLKSDGSIMSFDDFVSNVSIPAIRRHSGPGMSSRHGLYATHLRKWFDCFDRSQILVLSYEELQHQPQKVQDRVQLFLGRDIAGTLRHSNSNDHPSKVKVPSDTAQNTLTEIFQTPNEDLYQLLDASPGPSMEQRPFPRFAKTSSISDPVVLRASSGRTHNTGAKSIR